MAGEMIKNEPVKYSEQEKEQAEVALKRQFKDFDRNARSAVLELLRRMIVGSNDFAEHRLEEVLHVMGEELLTAEAWGANQNDRGENLALLGRQGNGLVGRVFTVNEIKEILEKA